MRQTAFPKIIEIQFHNLCNSDCIICPYKDMHYKPAQMTEDLFFKILNEIKTEKVERIIPYLNNEPFMDKNYIMKLKIIRELCPNIEIEISTNAALLTENIIKELSKLNITELRLSVFGFFDETYKRFMPKLNKNIVFRNLEIISQEFGQTDCDVSIVMVDNGIITDIEFNKMKEYCDKLGFKFHRWGFLDRAKNVSSFTNGFYNKEVTSCEQKRPFERMHILADGKVIFCCQDWKHKYVVGDSKNMSLKAIWNGSKYEHLRRDLTSITKKAPEICCNCKLAHCKGEK